ncbi:putative membrane protein [Yarrowia sp. B02]|nr:putative membrane protein [Yarrowia sp. B02]
MGLIETVGESVGLDYVQGKVGDIAGHHLNQDPYFHEDEQGNQKKLKAPPGCTEYQTKKWKELKQTAWNHDRCCCGCFWADCGVGLCPIVCIIPVIGPILMWAMRGHIVTLAKDLGCPESVQMKMNSNILIDFLLGLVPVLGPWFAWLNGCSTRNAAIAHNWLAKDVEKKGGWVSHSGTGVSNTARTGLGAPTYTQSFDGGQNGGYDSHRNAHGTRDMRAPPPQSRQMPRQQPRQQPRQAPPQQPRQAPPQSRGPPQQQYNPYAPSPPQATYQSATSKKKKSKAGQSGVQQAGYY